MNKEDGLLVLFFFLTRACVCRLKGQVWLSFEQRTTRLLMFSERHYARDTARYDDQRTSALVWILCAMGAGFVIQQIFESLIPGAASIPTQAVSLVPGLFVKGFVWPLLTYPLLHAGLLHVIINGAVIYFMGREVLPVLGNKRFYALFAFSAIGGGLAWLAANFHRDYRLIGADSVAYALFIFFTCLNPNNRIRALLFFVIPVTIVPKRVAIILTAVFFCGLLFIEIPGRHVSFSLNYSAYLGGSLGAVAFYFLVYRRRWGDRDEDSRRVLPEWLHRKKKPAAVATPKYAVNVTSRDDLKAELDRILDKINSHGFASLTDEEKRTLDAAKDLLSGR
jgi:membrane associated rhomboid family serine protease